MTSTTFSRAIVAGNADVLHAIREEDVSFAFWERKPPSGVGDIALNGLRNLRFTASLGEMPDTLDQELESAGFKKGTPRNNLATDILDLANHFAAVMRLNKVEIRLEHVTTNACKKFHGDYVTARLICTYVGPGTQWLDGADTEDCGCGEPHNIQQMNAGDVGLFKGRIWSETHPAIHRSPPIEGTGEGRLMLVINPPHQNDTKQPVVVCR
ncbi:MAG: DUF1826 domain-containing protein [Sphingomonadales bacterium]|jgi:hypothetical protein